MARRELPALEGARQARRVRRPAPGSAPGSIVPPDDAEPTVVRVVAYGPDALVEETLGDLGRLDALQAAHPVVWVDVRGFADLGRLRALAERFGVHPLALSDVVHTDQRPKLEEYEDHVFVVLRATAPGELTLEQDSLFLGPGFVLSFQERGSDCFAGVRRRIQDGSRRIRASGADYLLYALLDEAVDTFFPQVEAVGDRLLALEDAIFAGTDSELIATVHGQRRELLQVRRAVEPLGDVLTALQEDPLESIAEATHPFLRDCADHVALLLDRIDTARDVGKSLMDLHMALVSFRTGEITKVLTIIATIFIPLSFVAGVYGMNFSSVASPWNMPELNAYWGYPAVLGVMAAIALGLLAHFRRKGWLG